MYSSTFSRHAKNCVDAGELQIMKPTSREILDASPTIKLSSDIHMDWKNALGYIVNPSPNSFILRNHIWTVVVATAWIIHVIDWESWSSGSQLLIAVNNYLGGR